MNPNPNTKYGMTTAKTIAIFPNGIPYEQAQKIVVNEKQTPNLVQLLDIATRRLQRQLPNCVERLTTPQHGTRVRCLEEIRNCAEYVAIPRGQRFKPCQYGKGMRLPAKSKRAYKGGHHKNTTSGRVQQDYEEFNKNVKIIKCVCTYDYSAHSQEKKIVLTGRDMKSMEQVHSLIQDRLCSLPIRELINKADMKKIHDTSAIKHGGQYVARQHGQSGNQIAHLFDVSSESNQASRFPPIKQRQMIHVTTSPRDATKSKQKTGPLKTSLPPLERKVSKQTSSRRSVKNIQKQDSVANITLSASPPNPRDESSSEDGFFSSVIEAAKEAVSDRLSDGEQNEKEKSNEKEESKQESIARTMFGYEASGMQKERGKMVVENKTETQVEKLIDDLPAEEVLEDITENVEEATTKVDEGREDTEKTIEERIRETIDEGKDKLTENVEEAKTKADEGREDTEKTIEERLRETIDEGKDKVEEKQDALHSTLRDDDAPTEDGIEEVVLTAEGDQQDRDGVDNEGINVNESNGVTSPPSEGVTSPPSEEVTSPAGLESSRESPSPGDSENPGSSENESDENEDTTEETDANDKEVKGNDANDDDGKKSVDNPEVSDDTNDQDENAKKSAENPDNETAHKPAENETGNGNKVDNSKQANQLNGDVRGAAVSPGKESYFS